MVMRLRKQRHFPRPHDMKYGWIATAEPSNLDERATIIPITSYDEGLGAPSAYNANPEHASFAEYGGANCFPNSRIDNIKTTLEVGMTKGALTTDAMSAIKFATMPIYISSLNDLTANDEKSGLDISELIELQSETTDRQTFPLYTGDGDKIVEKFAGSFTAHADHEGLTTTQVFEGITFSSATLYDALHYYTNSGKLKSCIGGLKWHMLTRNHSVKQIHYFVKPKTKRMLPYSFFGLMVFVPHIGSYDQVAQVADTTADLPHLEFRMRIRYNEWNEAYDMDSL